jgi:hypothetical protein
MWPVTEMTRRSSATHARADELRAGPVRLIDAVQLCAWNDEIVHLEHCECCGGDDASGSWIALRRSGDRVLWVPAFGAMAQEPIDWSSEEYAPPDYVRSRGVPVFLEGDLRRALPELPLLERIRDLTRRDVALALQLESEPLLGRFPAPPRVERGWMIAGSEPSLDETLDALDALLSVWVEDDRSCVELAVALDDRAVWIYAEAERGTDWRPLAHHEGRLALRFEPGLVAL